MQADKQPLAADKQQLLLRRSRACYLPCGDPSASTERLAAYLALQDRPLAALLARDRLEQLASGRFLYRSRPLRLLTFSLQPSLELSACWRDHNLALRSQACSLAGLSPWAAAFSWGLSADLRPAPAQVQATASVWLAMPPSLAPWCRSLATVALEQVLDRLEHRLQRGLAKDLAAWLGETGQLAYDQPIAGD